MAQKWPKTIQSGPKWPKYDPKWPNYDPKWPNIALETQNDPKWPKNDPKLPKILRHEQEQGTYFNKKFKNCRDASASTIPTKYSYIEPQKADCGP